MNFNLNRTIVKWLRNRKTKLLMVGQSDSGKSSILNTLGFNEFIKEEKYDFFYLKTFEYRNCSMKIFTIGSAADIFPVYRKFFPDVDGVIFVINTCERNKIDEARKYLFKFSEDEALRNSVFLIFATRSESICSMNSDELQNKLEIKKIRNECKIVRCCEYTRFELYEGLQWICETIKNKDDSLNT